MSFNIWTPEEWNHHLFEDQDPKLVADYIRNLEREHHMLEEAMKEAKEELFRVGLVIVVLSLSSCMTSVGFFACVWR